MTDYAWPNFKLTRFQMRCEPLTKTFASPYGNTVQAIDMIADIWRVQMDLAGGGVADFALGLAIEAFFDRLKGTTNRIILPNLKLRLPRGTMRGSPTLTGLASQLSNLLAITTTPGATLLTGDMIGVGGQLFRVMADVTADGSGHMASVEVAPRVRAAAGIAAGSAVTWNAPTAPFLLMSQNPAVDWRPGEFAAPSIELRESLT